MVLSATSYLDKRWMTATPRSSFPYRLCLKVRQTIISIELIMRLSNPEMTDI